MAELPENTHNIAGLCIAYFEKSDWYTNRFKYRKWPAWLASLLSIPTARRSTTMPWKRVYMYDKAWDSEGKLLPATWLVPILAHEAVHARQMGNWFKRWFYWTPRYLWSGGPGNGKFLISQEVEAEAVEAVWRAIMSGRNDVNERDCSHGMTAGGTYKLPASTDPVEITARILARAREILPEVQAEYKQIISSS